MNETNENKPNKAQIDANIKILIQLNTTGLPDGAVLEHYKDRCDDWAACFYQDKVVSPYGLIYRLVLPKLAPHPTILSAIEWLAFHPQNDKWLAVDRDGKATWFKDEPIALASSSSWSDGEHYWMRLIDLHFPHPNWKECVWSLEELKSIVKEMKAAEKETEKPVDLSEAEAWFKYQHENGFSGNLRALFQEAQRIGERIAEQRKETS